MNKQDYQTKLLQVFRYLQSYHSLKNPIRRNLAEYEWYLWLDELPEHEAVVWNHLASGADEINNFDEDFIMKIRRPVSESCPEPPAALRGWLSDDWRDPECAMPLLASEQEHFFAPRTVAEISMSATLADHPEMTALYREWDEKREKWRLRQLKARRVLEVYDKFYHLYSQLKREAEQVELVLSDGILKAQTVKGELVQQTLIAQRVELLFDSELPEFKIVASECKPEFNSDLLRQISQINTDALGDCRVEFETRIGFLYDNDAKVNAFLTSLAARLESEGRFTADREEFKHINEVIAILKRPVLLLRQRTMGFGAFLAQIVTDITQGDELPPSLANILGFETEPPQIGAEPESSDFGAVNGESEAVLFAKEANIEQLQIIQKLERSGAVLVQGPPGTGKTHTIANLIGHFLAQGKTVLVTSHTSKALRVLKDKIVPALQALCVTVFNDEREQLERCVEVITEIIATNSPEALAKEAAKLSVLRSEILTCRLEEQRHLLELRQGEYRPISIGEQDYAVKTAAQIVAAATGVNDWIPSPVRMGSALPLTPPELAGLYHTNLTLTSEDETELRLPLPDVAELWSPDEMERLLAEVERGKNVQPRGQADYWAADRKNDIAALAALLAQISKAGSDIKTESLWERNVRAAGFLDSNYRRPWEALMENIRVAFKQNASYQTIWIDYEPQIPAEMISEVTRDDLEEIITYLRDGKKINFLALLQHSRWKEIIIKLRVKSALPVTLEHFQYLHQGIQLELAREILKQRWRKLITEAGGPGVDGFGSNPESGMRQYLDKIGNLLNWYAQQWQPLERQLTQLGFAWNAFWQDQPPVEADPSGMGRLAAACGELEQELLAQQNRLRVAEIQKQLKLKAEVLDQYRNSNGMARTIRNLQTALANGDGPLYRQAYQRIRHLAAKYADWKLRQNSLKKLAPMAPAWAEAIRNRVGRHGLDRLPGDPVLAWEWRQLHDELELRDRESLDRLQRQLDQLNQQLRQVTARLIEKRTWAKICNTSMTQRQALIGWKELIKKMGKRTGNRMPILLEEARKLMPQCQAAVPVWIMPLVRVAENFNPGVNRFDVVIIDEASQSDPLALSALYLGKQVVVVGDDQQVSPDAVGQNQAEIQNLINDYLRDIPNRQLYDGQSSVYDLAKCSFEPVCLKEHFRCVAPIIEFSNRLSYDGRIKPLRDASTVALKPPTVAYRVSDGVAHNQLNQAESETVAALLVACLEQPEYADATFGVISLLGTEQAVAIDAILRRRLSEKEYTKRQILCGNPAQFQGDEREVIFISVVDSSQEVGPLNLRSFGAQEMYRKRYNVAASRARDQLWVVHSLDPDTDLKTDDLRLSLINHARNPEDFTQSAAPELRPPSEMEQAVREALTQKGYQVFPQWKVGVYRIDMVVVDREQKVALECDGEKFHTEATLSADLARQAVLERLGWRFIRIRCSQFYRDPDQALAVVVAQLQAYQIYPAAPAETEPVAENSLLKRVSCRAVELRREWNAPPVTTAGRITPNDRATEDDQAVELVSYLNAKSVETIDLRPKGGDLWIVADSVSAPVIEELKGAGYRFKYYQNGVKASENRAAWCLVEG